MLQIPRGIKQTTVSEHAHSNRTHPMLLLGRVVLAEIRDIADDEVRAKQDWTLRRGRCWIPPGPINSSCRGWQPTVRKISTNGTFPSSNIAQSSNIRVRANGLTRVRSLHVCVLLLDEYVGQRIFDFFFFFFYAVGDAERTNENELLFTSRYEKVDSDENSVSGDKMI